MLVFAPQILCQKLNVACVPASREDNGISVVCV